MINACFTFFLFRNSVTCDELGTNRQHAARQFLSSPQESIHYGEVKTSMPTHAPKTACLLVESTYPITRGGISTWADQLIRGLPNIQFTVVRIEAQEDATSTLTPQEWAYAFPKNVQTLLRIPAPRCMSMEGVRFWSHQQQERLPSSHIYHAAGTGLAAALALSKKHMSGGRCIVSEHARAVHEIREDLICLESGQKFSSDASSALRLRALMHQLEKQAYAKADAVVALSIKTQTRQLHAGLARHRSYVVPNTIEAQSPRHRSSSALNVSCFVHMGRVSPLKGSDLFLEAALILHKKQPQVGFAQIGPWDCDDAYRHRCTALGNQLGSALISIQNPKSQTVSHSPSQNAWHALNTTSMGMRPKILVLSSLSEAQPYVVLEALTQGIPIIAPKKGDIPELITDPTTGAQAGILLTDLNRKTLCHAMQTMIQNPSRYHAMQYEAENRAHAWASIAAKSDNYTHIYAEQKSIQPVASISQYPQSFAKEAHLCASRS